MCLTLLYRPPSSTPQQIIGHPEFGRQSVSFLTLWPDSYPGCSVLCRTPRWGCCPRRPRSHAPAQTPQFSEFHKEVSQPAKSYPAGLAFTSLSLPFPVTCNSPIHLLHVTRLFPLNLSVSRLFAPSSPHPSPYISFTCPTQCFCSLSNSMFLFSAFPFLTRPDGLSVPTTSPKCHFRSS